MKLAISRKISKNCINESNSCKRQKSKPGAHLLKRLNRLQLLQNPSSCIHNFRSKSLSTAWHIVGYGCTASMGDHFQKTLRQVISWMEFDRACFKNRLQSKPQLPRRTHINQKLAIQLRTSTFLHNKQCHEEHYQC